MTENSQQSRNEDALVKELREIVGHENVLSDPDELLVYESDGLPQHKHPPRAVVFPASTDETSEVLEVLYDQRVSFAPRGAGTGLSGGALAINRGVVVELARMRKILHVDRENRTAVVQTGLVNAQLSRAVFHHGLYYVPDPSSQPSCTIGGNIAENAGGIHCLKYGTTTDHVIGARVVLSDGKVVDLTAGAPGYDLLGTFVGSEGTFGIATEATVRLTPIPQAIRTLLADFTDIDNASRAVSAIIAGGMLPAALEMMDQEIICALEASVFAAGLPTDARAVLLVELDGIEAGIDDDAEKASEILRDHGARSVRRAADESERKKLWAARKGSFGAVGRLSPDIMIQDAVVPRSRLPEVLAETYRISARHNVRLANVFHAGDGNLHPLIYFDLRRGDDLERVRQASREIMETCVRAGGSITGEHGVGLDKTDYLSLIFSEDDMNAMLQVRAAFDPTGLCNPGKIIPVPGGCGEARAVATVKASSFQPTVAVRPAQARSESGGKPIEKRTLLVARINDTRIKRELCLLVGADRVHRLSISSPNLAGEEERVAERILEVAPASTEETCEVMRFASRENLALVPAGTGNWLDAGNAPSRADVVLTTRRMKSVVTHEPADLVATAAAGVTLRDFQKHLAQAGQWLPIDPPDDGNATLGGVVATSLAGPQNFGYGPVRSFVIGMRVVLSDGRLIKAGGSVVKNVAGYDLCKLFTGSYGTLGLITELTFKLRPRPAEERTVMAVGRLDSLMSAARQIAQQFFPAALELISPRLARNIRPETKQGELLLLVRFAGSSRAVISETAQALKLLREGGDRLCETLDDDADLWRRLSAEPYQFLTDLSWRVRLKPTDLTSFVSEVSALEGDEMSLSWHAGLGDGRLRLMARPAVNLQDALRLLEPLRQKAENLGGHLVVESAPTGIKEQFEVWGSLGSTAELMKRIKAQLDPENVLSPGRFFG
jgi:glycolate oxidase subunit GlcD